MVTASHNPPQDNGYKVYLGDGSQIVPPADAEIAARIAAVGALRRRAARRRPARSSTRTSSTATSTPSPAWRPTARATCALVYTPLHGVGGTSVLQVLETAGFAAPAVVAQQERARPGLPDRRVPQPRGAGRDGPRHGAGRRSAAPTWWSPTTPTPTAAPPPYPARTAGGCCAATRSARCSATTCCRQGKRGTYAARSCRRRCSASMAAAHGQPYVETLTGFKWIGRVPGLAFGYEEALGYCVDPEHVRDKDGVSALLLLCELAAAAKAAGRTPARPARRHRRASTACTPPTSSRCASSDLSLIGAAMARLRDDPAHLARRPRGRARRRPGAGRGRPAARPTACATGSPTAPG